MCLNTLYLCSAYRKIYSSFFCSISWWWWLIVSFVLPSLSSVFLSMGCFMFILLLVGPVTQPPKKSNDPFEAGAAVQEGATEDCSCLFWLCGEMPLLFLFWDSHTLWFYWVEIFICDFSSNLQLGNTLWKHCKLLAKQEESFTKFSNITNIWNCHSCLHLSSEEGKLLQAR